MGEFKYIECKYIECKYIEFKYIECKYIEQRCALVSKYLKYIEWKYIEFKYIEHRCALVRKYLFRNRFLGSSERGFATKETTISVTLSRSLAPDLDFYVVCHLFWTFILSPIFSQNGFSGQGGCE